jgi:TIR domain
VNLRPFDVFICHKKSSGKDFADHLKAGLEEIGYHAFLDSKDIPKMTDGVEEWIQIRDRALKESRNFIVIMTPGFDLSNEVKNELRMARAAGHRNYLYFRQRDMGRKIVVDLGNEKLDLSRQEQVSFENKEELLRLAIGILLKEGGSPTSQSSTVQEMKAPTAKKNSDEPNAAVTNAAASSDAPLCCEMCSKPIEGQPYVEIIDEAPHNFHCRECAKTFRRFKSLYGEDFK